MPPPRRKKPPDPFSSFLILSSSPHCPSLCNVAASGRLLFFDLCFGSSSRGWVATNSAFDCWIRSIYCTVVWPTSFDHRSGPVYHRSEARFVIHSLSVIFNSRPSARNGKSTVRVYFAFDGCEVWLFISLSLWVSILLRNLTLPVWWSASPCFRWHYLFVFGLCSFVSFCAWLCALWSNWLWWVFRFRVVVTLYIPAQFGCFRTPPVAAFVCP